MATKLNSSLSNDASTYRGGIGYPPYPLPQNAMAGMESAAFATIGEAEDSGIGESSKAAQSTPTNSERLSTRTANNSTTQDHETPTQKPPTKSLSTPHQTSPAETTTQPPKDKTFPTLPPLLLVRPLKYFNDHHRKPHLHAGKLRLLVPTGVDINGNATGYVKKPVYPPVRHMQAKVNKKLIPVFSGNRVIALVAGGAHLTQNNTARARRRGVIPARPLTMAQLRQQTAFNPPSKKDIVAHLEFDQRDGDIMLDTSGHNNNAIMTGAATSMRTKFSCGVAQRLMGGQISFDGTAFNPKPLNGISVAAWIKLNSTTGRQSVFYTVGRGQYDLAVVDGKIYWSHIDENNRNTFILLTEKEVVKPDKWAHIVCTYDAKEGNVIICFKLFRFFITLCFTCIEVLYLRLTDLESRKLRATGTKLKSLGKSI